MTGVWLGKTRFVQFMNEMSWQGRNDWTVENVGTALLPFAEWVSQHEQYIVKDEVREAVHLYFFTDETTNPGRNFYYKLNQGRQALAAVYNYSLRKNDDNTN